MRWEVAAHRGFLRDLRSLGAPAEERIREALRRLVDALDAAARPDPQKTFASGPILPSVDLRPLRASNIPGSYRLRVGPWRVALVIMPDERAVYLTVAIRRDATSYRGLPALHRKRFQDREGRSH